MRDQSLGFNRTTVELKYEIEVGRNILKQSFNRTTVELKYNN